MKNTIKSTNEISSLFDGAKRYKARTFIVLIGDCNDRRGLNGRVAYIAGKKLGSAPLRSRAKRRLRAAVAASRADSCGHDLVFIASKATLLAGFQEIVSDVKRLCKRFESNRS